MRTARSLTVSRSISRGCVCHACPPATHAPLAMHTPLPCMPPLPHVYPATHAPCHAYPRCHVCPPPCTPPTTHTPCHACLPHHTCPLPCTPPSPRTPSATSPSPMDRILDTHFWKYYLAPTSLRAVNISNVLTSGNTQLQVKITVTLKTERAIKEADTIELNILNHRAIKTNKVFQFIHNSRLIRWIQQNNFYKKINRIDQIACLAVRSGTLTIILECFLCLCEAVIESYLCIGDYVQFI